MTLLLIVSSVWMVKGLAAIERDDYVTFRSLIGLTPSLVERSFWPARGLRVDHLIHEGLVVHGTPWASLFGTTFSSLQVFHGMHVTAAVIYLLCIWLRGMSGAQLH